MPSSRVAVVTAPGTLRARDARRRAPRGRGARARPRVRAVRLGRQALLRHATRRSSPPLLPGHEFHGTVEAVGGRRGHEPGADVTIFPPIGCGRCRKCRAAGRTCARRCRSSAASTRAACPSSSPCPRATRCRSARTCRTSCACSSSRSPSACTPRRGRPPRRTTRRWSSAPARSASSPRSRCATGASSSILLADVADNRLALAARLGAGETVDTSESRSPTTSASGCGPRAPTWPSTASAARRRRRDALAATRKGGRAVLVGITPRELAVDGVALSAASGR